MWQWDDIVDKNKDVNWHSSRDTLDLKLKVKWHLSNIHTASNEQSIGGYSAKLQIQLTTNEDHLGQYSQFLIAPKKRMGFSSDS